MRRWQERPEYQCAWSSKGTFRPVCTGRSLQSKTGARQEPVIDLQHEGSKCGVVDRVVLVSWSWIWRSSEVTVSLLPAQEGVSEHIVVVEPALAAMIDSGLTYIIVLVKVTGSPLVTHPGISVDVIHSLTGRPVVGALVLLKAQYAGTGEGKVSASNGTRAGITEASIAVLTTLAVCQLSLIHISEPTRPY